MKVRADSISGEGLFLIDGTFCCILLMEGTESLPEASFLKGINLFHGGGALMT
jgi:hypothetical protein